jgi:hypothetical protein
MTNGSGTDRAREKTAPPDFLGVADPPGPIRYALAYRDGQRVGAVWMTEHRATVPRAGILIDPGNVDGPFQDDLGPLTLSVRGNRELDPGEWLDHLSETRTGVGGTLAVGEARQAPSLDAVRGLLRTG